jgi:hypothetical protein
VSDRLLMNDEMRQFILHRMPPVAIQPVCFFRHKGMRGLDVVAFVQTVSLDVSLKG